MARGIVLDILGAGAAQSLIRRFEPEFRRATGFNIAGAFGAVGEMAEKFVAGAPCDLIILSAPRLDALVRDGAIDRDSVVPIGRVRTGLAAPDRAEAREIADGASLRRVLDEASALFFPDPLRATAGIHFMAVLRALALDQSLAGRLRPFANGGTAMRNMVACGDAQAVGCTQKTEILATFGVRWLGPLPPGHDLATVYSLGIPRRAVHAEAAQLLAGLLTAPGAAATRADCGFE
jgi:molybdate transport system substrate-binding protein